MCSFNFYISKPTKVDFDLSLVHQLNIMLNVQRPSLQNDFFSRSFRLKKMAKQVRAVVQIYKRNGNAYDVTWHKISNKFTNESIELSMADKEQVNIEIELTRWMYEINTSSVAYEIAVNSIGRVKNVNVNIVRSILEIRPNCNCTKTNAHSTERDQTELFIILALHACIDCFDSSVCEGRTFYE